MDFMVMLKKIPDCLKSHRVSITVFISLFLTILIANMLTLNIANSEAIDGANQRIEDIILRKIKSENYHALLMNRPENAELTNNDSMIKKMAILNPFMQVFASSNDPTILDVDRTSLSYALKGKLVKRRRGNLTEIYYPVNPDGGRYIKDIIGVIYVLYEPYSARSSIKFGILLAAFVGLLLCAVVVFLRSKKKKASNCKDAEKSNLSEVMDLFECEWRKFIHISGDAVLLLDQQCRLVEMNELAQEWFGYKDDFHEGKHILDLVKNRPEFIIILDLIESQQESKNNFISKRLLDNNTSVFKTDLGLNRFKYAVVISRLDRCA